MNELTLTRLEYPKIKERLMEYAVSYLGRRQIEELAPYSNVNRIHALLEETEEAKCLLEKSSSIPLPSMDGMERVLGHLGKGYVLREADFSAAGTFLHSLGQMKKFMARWESAAPQIGLYARSLHDYTVLREVIERSIRNGRVADEGSAELGKVRKMMAVVEDRLKKKLDSLVTKHRGALQEAIVSTRNGRYVIPVKKEHRRLVPGTVLDESSSGQTVYVEPHELASLQAEWNELKVRESVEEDKVLSCLTELLEQEAYALESDMETLGHYDFLFAKAKYACSITGRSVPVNEDGIVRLVQARHPLLGRMMVPLDFAIGGEYRALIITGPNTGGKTVALKTVGLLTLMAQSGLLVPVGEGSELSVFRTVEADIGDGQSLEQSLSTFSAHIRNLIGVLDRADRSALVLLDELASGTDPGEGIGLSIAVLEELYARGATLVATTHYNEIKEFAAAAHGFRNARMEFDAESLTPLYRLTIGEAGSSYAFHIALKLGMNPRIVDRSRQIAAQSISLKNGAAAHAFHRGTAPKPANLQTAENTAGKAQSVRKPREREADSAGSEKRRPFEVGDCVFILPLKRTGIVYRPADERGMVEVQVEKKKLVFNRKRLSLYIEAAELYPGSDYDMDIVFEDKDVRKKRKLMSRKHVDGLTIEIKNPEA